MRLDRLWIKDFKNLRDVTIDFDESHWITVLIGWNGAGKSNVLEAVLTIFRDLLMGENAKGAKRKPSFTFKLDYKIRDTCVSLAANAEGNPSYQVRVSKAAEKAAEAIPAGKELSSAEFFKSIDQYIPEYIFGYYSGASNRFASLFDKYVAGYDKRLRAGEDPGFKKLFYAMPVHSNFVLLSFILNESKITNDFLSRQLGMQEGGIDSVLFVLKEPSWAKSSREGDARFWNARGVVSKFLSDIYDVSLAPLRFKRRVDTTMWNKSEKEFLYLYIKDLASLKKTAIGLKPREYFQKLESTYVSELIEEVRIRVKLKKNDGSVTFKELSEGEQQLLTVLGLLKFTAEEESLFLLDEPDTHLNPKWSVEYLKTLEKFIGKDDGKENSHIVLTTHNPMAVAELVKEQVQILKRDDKTLKISVHSPDVDPRGMGYAGVITSEMFGLESSVDSYTQGMLEEKRLLSLKAKLSATDQKKLKDLNTKMESLGFRYEVRDPDYTRFLRERYESRPQKSIKKATAGSKKKAAALIKAVMKENDVVKGKK